MQKIDDCKEIRLALTRAGIATCPEKCLQTFRLVVTAQYIYHRACKYKEGLLISHGVPMPVDGVSVCQFCLTLGRERKPSTRPARGGHRRRSPSLKVLTVKDFSSASIEEHISYEMGSLLNSLHEKDYDFASDDPGVRYISALELEEVDSSDSDDNCDESNNVCRRGYIATISCRQTFTHVLDLVKTGLSYRQVEAVMFLTRRIIPKANLMLNRVSRQTASVFTRLVAARGLEDFRRVMQRSWALSVAADASAHVHGVANFSIRMRLVSTDESKISLHIVHLLATPHTESQTGKFMYDLTESVLSALDSHWGAKLIGSTSDGAANMMGIYSG
jgi:hypothetical protein